VKLKIGGGINIHKPKIGIPNVDIDLIARKIGGDIDIKRLKVGLLNQILI